MSSASANTPDVSVIVPVVERHDSLERLHDEFAAALAATGRSFEFLFVVDGMQSRAIEDLKSLKGSRETAITIVVLRRTSGEATALSVGFDRARAPVVMTLAAYFQVDAGGIGRAFDLIARDEADLVVGRRYPRKGSIVNRVQAVVFHWLVTVMTATRFHDISCGFKVMRRHVAEELVLYGDLHRFIPILALHRGFLVKEVDMPQRVEDRALRLYGPGTYLRRLLDVLTIFFLTNFTRKPLRFFGLIGSAIFGIGSVITLYLGLYRLLGFGGIANRPLLLAGLLMMVLGVQSISIGLLGEIVIFTHAREIKESQIAEVI